MQLKNLDTLKVFANIRGNRQEVGILKAIYTNNTSTRHKIYFEYHEDFIQNGFSLSPFALKLEKRPIDAPFSPFEGLHGVFADSLPDSWGRLLLDRAIKRVEPDIVLSPLQRLACVGNKGMGCLEYEPVFPLPVENLDFDLDGLADESRNLLEKDTISEQSLADLLRLNGSSGGARPKILVDITENGRLLPCNSGVKGTTSWIIKFPCQHDADNIGIREYVWSILAQEFGLEMAKTRLFPSKRNTAYFATQRFDRDDSNKIHVATAAGLLHADASQPCLDYENLLKLCKLLTKDIKEVKKLVKLMVFNVVMNNTDDHAKNFSFQLDTNFEWKLAPAYDLAPQRYTVEHMAAVNNKGKNITDNDMVIAVSSVGVEKAFVVECIDQMKDLADKENGLIEATKEEILASSQH